MGMRIMKFLILANCASICTSIEQQLDVVVIIGFAAELRARSLHTAVYDKHSSRNGRHVTPTAAANLI